MIKQRRLDVRPRFLAWLALASLGLTVETRGNTITVLPASEGTDVVNTLMGTTNTFLPGLQPVSVNQFGSTSPILVFDLSSIPRGVAISIATFTMSANGSVFNMEPINLTVYENIAPSSAVSLSNFNQNGNYGTMVGDLQGLQANAPPGSLLNAVTTFDVTSLVQLSVSSQLPYEQYQFVIVNSSGIVDIPGATLPSLTITSPAQLSVPEPPGALLIVLGLTGVLIVIGARSRKAAYRAASLAKVVANS